MALRFIILSVHEDFLLLFLLFSFFVSDLHAQTDTIPVLPKDTLQTIQRTDTQKIIRRSVIPRRISIPVDTILLVDSSLSSAISLKPVADSLIPDLGNVNFWKRFRDYVYEKNLLIGFANELAVVGSDRKMFKGKEPMFYYIIFLLVLFGLLRQAFEKYFNDLFRVFFRTTLKQRQIREQLLQSPLPSVLLNAFFILSGGLYLNFILQYYNFSLHSNFWMQYLYCMGGLSAIYLVKYLGLQLTGWLINVRNATDSYTFVVFIINKMLGIFLLPFLVFLAFTKGTMFQVALTLSWVGIGLLLIYRFILSYTAVRKEITLNPFHFILYLLAFEVVPLLLIYKLLLMIF